MMCLRVCKCLVGECVSENMLTLRHTKSHIAMILHCACQMPEIYTTDVTCTHTHARAHSILIVSTAHIQPNTHTHTHPPKIQNQITNKLNTRNMDTF